MREDNLIFSHKLQYLRKENCMKIIFLDIDGVLNGYSFWNMLGWKIVSFIDNKNLRLYYTKITDPHGIHENKVKLLSKIVKATDAQIVYSSSWKRNLFWKPYHSMNADERKLIDLFNYYGIHVKDATPTVKYISGENTREKEILQWLAIHEKDVDKYIIIDDETFSPNVLCNDERFIKTSFNYIKIFGKKIYLGFSGLRKSHVKKAIKILNSI